MKTVNQLITEYTDLLKQGEIQTAYRGIIEFMGKLRADFTKNFPHYEIGSLYQGYMDMTYFSLSSKPMKDKGLKYAIVYEHNKGAFEVWLSARNRDIAKKYETVFKGIINDDITVFHDYNNLDAIVECTLTSLPDFEEQAKLIEIIEQGVDKFITDINMIVM